MKKDELKEIKRRTKMNRLDKLKAEIAEMDAGEFAEMLQKKAYLIFEKSQKAKYRFVRKGSENDDRRYPEKNKEHLWI